MVLCGVTLVPGIRLLINSAATSDLLLSKQDETFIAWHGYINCYNTSYGPADIALPEQELPVQIADINCIHVNHVDVSEPHEGQILQKFTAQTGYNKMKKHL